MKKSLKNSFLNQTLNPVYSARIQNNIIQNGDNELIKKLKHHYRNSTTNKILFSRDSSNGIRIPIIQTVINNSISNRIQSQIAKKSLKTKIIENWVNDALSETVKKGGLQEMELLDPQIEYKTSNILDFLGISKEQLEVKF